MKTEQMIEVMQAYINGEQIEFFDENTKWHDCANPLWNWDRHKYRVKRKLTYRPYKNAEEFLDGQKKHGIWLIKVSDKNIAELPMTADNSGIELLMHTLALPYKEVLVQYKWQDGTPCGVKEE